MDKYVKVDELTVSQVTTVAEKTIAQHDVQNRIDVPQLLRQIADTQAKLDALNVKLAGVNSVGITADTVATALQAKVNPVKTTPPTPKPINAV